MNAANKILLRRACVKGDQETIASMADEPHWSEQDLADTFETVKEDVNDVLRNEGVAAEELEITRLNDALVMSASTRAWGTADKLIEHGALIDGRDRWGQTAMHFAATRDLADVRQLLDRNAGANVFDWQFVSTPVGWAHQFKHEIERDHLLASAAIDPIDAALFGRFDRLDETISPAPKEIDGPCYSTEDWVARVMRRHHGGEGHPVLQGTRLGDPIRACAQHNDFEGVSKLLQRGAQADITAIRTGTFEREWLGRSALAWALTHENAKMADSLREAGAKLNLECAAVLGDLDLADNDGDPQDALFLAAMHGHHRAAGELLARGADPNRPASCDQQMRAPLCVAVSTGPEMTMLLLKAGADPEYPSLFGKTCRASTEDEAVITQLKHT
jgi:ankyrin repeat protein